MQQNILISNVFIIISFLFQIEDLYKIHYSRCQEHEEHEPVIQLSLDGILESKSSFTSLDVYSLAFNHCRSIYPIRILRPCERYKYDEQMELKKVLDDINENNFIIDCGVFDNLKRAIMRCAKNHSGKYACEYCYNSAITYIDLSKKVVASVEKRFKNQESQLSQQLSQLEESDIENEEEANNLREQIQNLSQEKDLELKKFGRKQLTWPASTMSGNLRTVEHINAIVNEIISNPDILKTDPDFCKGIKGKSLFLDQPSFHPIHDSPCEYMHSTCLGVVRRLLSLTFTVGETRERVTKRKLSQPKLYNDLIRNIQVVREFGRRCRTLDFGVMKAAEFRNVLIFFFPIVLKCIPDEFEEEHEMWLHLVFMIRSCILPNEEFENVDRTHIEYACKKFYHLFEKLFGAINCSYSIHIVPSHLLLIRGDQPLTFRSAFKFETFFSEMRKLFQPGTRFPIKQILQNCYVKRLLENHNCKKTTFFSPLKQSKEGVHPGKENNSLIYTFTENNIVKMYSIAEKLNENEFLCNEQGRFDIKIPLVPEYNWSSVGVFKEGPKSEDLHKIERKNISGKVIKVQNYLITCPLNVLHEV